MKAYSKEFMEQIEVVNSLRSEFERAKKKLQDLCPHVHLDGQTAFPRGLSLWTARSVGCRTMTYKVLDQVADVVCSNLGLEEVTATTDPVAVGMDDLDLSEITIDLEDAFGITLSRKVAKSWKTAGDIVTTIEQMPVPETRFVTAGSWVVPTMTPFESTRLTKALDEYKYVSEEDADDA